MKRPVLIGIIIIIIIIIAIVIYLCINRDTEGITETNTIKVENNNRTNRRLAIVVRDNYISPEGGINIEDAKELIVQHLISIEMEGDIRNHAKIKEITIQEAWENIGIQLYYVEIPWLSNGVIAISNDQVVGVLRADRRDEIFLADLNNDGIYKVVTIAQTASGFVRRDIQVLDVKNNRLYTYRRVLDALTLGIIDETGELGVYKWQDDEKVLYGRLAIVDGELVIDNRVSEEI